MFADPALAKAYMFDSFHLVDLYSTSENELLTYNKAAFAAMVLKQGIHRNFHQWVVDHLALIVELLEKDYIPYVDAVFRYMLTVDDHKDLLDVIKQSNPKLQAIVMSVAERLKQEGRQEGIQIGEAKGKLEGKTRNSKTYATSGGFDGKDYILILAEYGNKNRLFSKPKRRRHCKKLCLQKLWF